jgi:IS30 family transposase
MDTVNARKNKHLTEDDRRIIEEMLRDRATFREIAQTIGKDPSTISKEILKHRFIQTNSYTIRDEQGNVINPACPLLNKPPYVCNGCRRKTVCKLMRLMYSASRAENEYKQNLSESRSGIPLNKKEFYKMDSIITERVKNGQHLYQIMNNFNFEISMSTAYRYVRNGYFTFTVMDLPRAIKFKSRKKPYPNYVPKGLKRNRAYLDFINFIQSNEVKSWVELDTVIGRIGGKVIMTIQFVSVDFMLGFLLENKTAPAVAGCFDRIRHILESIGLKQKDIMPVILTDNGGEFANVWAIEDAVDNDDDDRQSHLFFCDPMRSCQKPHIEKNHTLLRDILPKKTSFDDLTQDKLNVIFSHINSTARASLNGKTPYNLFISRYSKRLADAFGIQYIPPEKVIQSPKLLKQLEKRI